jgi:hypothetical protein
MRYLLMMCKDEAMWDALSADERGAIFRRAVDFSEELRQRGLYLSGDPLEASTTATTVRLKGGKPVMTDGPFAETKEQLGGYSLIEAKDLDEALAVVVRHPLLHAGFSIEVRPIREGPPR